MEIAENKVFPVNKRGRPQFYPFSKLKPMTKLIVPGKVDLIKQRVCVSSALNNFKKVNGHNWTTVVIIEGENIAAYRKD